MSEPRQPVIVGGARTPVGRLLGSLASQSASDLGGVAIAGALERAGVRPEQVEYVIMGQVLQAGAGQITARQAAVAAGIPMSVPALTVNKVCLSGLDAIALAAQLVRLGEHDVVVAGGMESMTRAPHLLPNSRAGYKYGPFEATDSMAIDALTDAFDHLSMGESTENSGSKLGITRAEQDEFAAASHQRAAAAAGRGLFAAEIVGVTVPQRGGAPLTVTQDEGIRPGTTVESLARLRPAFRPDGTITAGSASQISDGAAAVLLLEADRADRLGLRPRARIVAQCLIGAEPYYHLDGPIAATERVLARSGMAIGDIDLFEVNEAFASVVLSWLSAHQPDPDRVNVNGGAIALGHPVGSTGARLITTALHELERRDASTALITMCAGGAMSTATIIERL